MIRLLKMFRWCKMIRAEVKEKEANKKEEEK